MEEIYEPNMTLKLLQINGIGVMSMVIRFRMGLYMLNVPDLW